MRTEERKRRLRGSEEPQTAQEQPITGTPVEVPVPKNVSLTSLDGLLLNGAILRNQADTSCHGRKTNSLSSADFAKSIANKIDL
jgi:hypothetical protein